MDCPCIHVHKRINVSTSKLQASLKETDDKLQDSKLSNGALIHYNVLGLLDIPQLRGNRAFRKPALSLSVIRSTSSSLMMEAQKASDTFGFRTSFIPRTYYCNHYVFQHIFVWLPLASTPLLSYNQSTKYPLPMTEVLLKQFTTHTHPHTTHTPKLHSSTSCKCNYPVRT